MNKLIKVLVLAGIGCVVYNSIESSKRKKSKGKSDATKAFKEKVEKVFDDIENDYINPLANYAKDEHNRAEDLQEELDALNKEYKALSNAYDELCFNYDNLEAKYYSINDGTCRDDADPKNKDYVYCKPLKSMVTNDVYEKLIEEYQINTYSSNLQSQIRKFLVKGDNALIDVYFDPELLDYLRVHKKNNDIMLLIGLADTY